jgi:hypothetical protein
MQSKNGLLACCLAIVLLAPVLYIAASGPVVWLGTRGYLSLEEGSAADRVYRPLGWLIKLSPASTTLAERWIDLWAASDPMAPPY